MAEERIRVYPNISEDTPPNKNTPRNQAISMMYQDYMETKNIQGLSPEEAACVIAQGFARYLLDHLAELEALTKERARGMEEAKRAWKERYPDAPDI